MVCSELSRGLASRLNSSCKKNGKLCKHLRTFVDDNCLSKCQTLKEWALHIDSAGTYNAIDSGCRPNNELVRELAGHDRPLTLQRYRHYHEKALAAR